MQTFTIRGLPQSLAMDSWWLGTDAQPSPPGATSDSGAPAARRPVRAAGLLLLVVLADHLFWGYRAGLSLGLFAAAILAVGTVGLRPAHRLVRPALLFLLAALPLLEHVQLLSLLFLVVGLAGALLLARNPETGTGSLAQHTLRFLRRLPLDWLLALNPRRLEAALLGLFPRAGRSGWRLWSRNMLRLWAFPVAGGAVFLALMISANPLFSRLPRLDLDIADTIWRVAFWAMIAVLVLPFIVPRPLAEPDMPVKRRRGPHFGINAASVLRALMLFNLLIATQVVSDVSILLVGAELPHGMSYADYAHRGAYPLLATALLAGAFALSARPFLREHRLIRPLMALWLAQNLLLCGAAALRLDLYIEAYGLTYLRLRALIWMALVATGLVLCLWQLARLKETRWLLLRVGMTGLATLYAGCFVNFAHLIAVQNLARPEPDIAYLCSLGPLAKPALAAASDGETDLVASCYDPRLPAISNWRDWDFRTWRASRYLEGDMLSERPE